MLKKALLKVFVEKIYLSPNEKQNTQITFTPDVEKGTLKISVDSISRFHFAYSLPIEKSDIFGVPEITEKTVTYKDFEKTVASLKAKSTLVLQFEKDSIIIHEHRHNKGEEGVSIANRIFCENSHLPVFDKKTHTVLCSNEDLANIINFSELKLNLEFFPEFSGVWVHREANILNFISSIGTSLHCCKIVIDETKDEIMEEIFNQDYIISSVFIKNIANFISEPEIRLTTGCIPMEKKDMLIFESDNMQMHIPVNTSLSPNKLVSIFEKVPLWLDPINPVNEIAIKSCSLWDKEAWKHFLKEEVQFRKKLHLEKQESMLTLKAASRESNADEAVFLMYLSANVKSNDIMQNFMEMVGSITFELNEKTKVWKNKNTIMMNSIDFIKFADVHEKSSFFACEWEDNALLWYLRKGNRYLFIPKKNVNTGHCIKKANIA